MTLTRENYYSQEANEEYLSASQFKAFYECEAGALAEIRGEHVRADSAALLFGSYVDAYFSDELEEFRNDRSELFTKGGGLKVEYRQAEEVIQRIQRDPMMMKYLSGEKQVIMTGEIEGVPFKIRMDSYHPGKAIVDLKTMRSLEPVWSAEEHRKLPWWAAWGYDIQGAVYQEIVWQNTGERLPFFLVVATKETEPDLEIGRIDQEVLDRKLSLVKALAPVYQEIKEGRKAPSRCGRCGYCRRTKVVREIMAYSLWEAG